MIIRRRYLSLLLVFSGSLANFSVLSQSPKISKQQKKADNITKTNLRNHIYKLSDDSFEGRRTGSKGEAKTIAYLKEQYVSLGIPAGDKGQTYIQSFEIDEGKFPEGTSVTLDEVTLDKKDYFPFAWSASTTIQKATSVALHESGEPWWYDVKEALETNANNPHFLLSQHIKEKAISAAKKGATAFLVYNTSEKDDSLTYNGKDRSDTVQIPVIFFTKNCIKKNNLSAQSSPYVDANISFSAKKRTGNNVLAFLNNGASRTVIIGAHLDHLGYGEDENSRHTGEPEIHNGADDNASGTAAVLELARILKEKCVDGKKNKSAEVASLRKANYLFIHFSAEELGLLGSKYFTENPTTDLSNVNYMINMDMIGRLNDSASLTVGGVGTSPMWPEVLQTSTTPGFHFKIDSSGTGPSDHTSFYRKNIPVLFFFTGLHTDYHKPSDDADKINYDGETSIVNYIVQVIENAGPKEKLAFTSTKEQTMGAGRYKVSVGIMPDYAFSGKGVRADGVIEGRPAQKAGLKTGDIIVKLGTHEVSDMATYMQALNQFEKGQTTTVTIIRGTEEKEFPISF
jgi:aminopeptidase YwaD